MDKYWILKLLDIMRVKKMLNFVSSLPKNAILFLIKFYQKTISPDHGWNKSLFPQGFCRFYPTCSEYGYQTIKKDGLIIGLFKAGWRVLRCNPWSKGGVDLP
ncbi:MAG: hypothetical protein UT67_C0006G0009 [Candidatus Magasanikbacteria bacterium GW2011_GWA2_40_10]|uniref:Putative membrane protein insertion efficiency factor n=1 Tax=Candidatus Magasanikbacteria bacterium GW2011_GWA2_40_10 TaxID=1619037 RepID=A0A0G0SJE9_9BACT|nr:MAG: hypothetical protein UT67_C0006G0009 [Candidatus Magasanikbacteria bacterium GW2011_GWA2_40_10]